MIYFDNASTTKCTEESINIVNTYMREKYFNPSSMYHEGICAKQDLESARETILKKLHADGKIYFTAGGTESDNLALLGSKKVKGGRVIISNAEHSAVYYTAMELKQRGFDVVLAPVTEKGAVDEEAFRNLLTPETTLVSVIHVSNETGAINDIGKLSALTKEIAPKALFHSDGVQAFGKIEINLRATKVDLYSMSAHKIGAPKGLGALYCAKNVNLSPIVFGGGQEGGVRSSTENTPAIMAFKAAAEARYSELNATHIKLNAIRAVLFDAIKDIPDIKILSDSESSPYIVTFSTPKVRGEVMQHALEREGILVGTGSACSSNKASRRVAEGLGLKGKYIDGVTRISLFIDNTIEEATEFAAKYTKLYKELSKYGS